MTWAILEQGVRWCSAVGVLVLTTGSMAFGQPSQVADSDWSTVARSLYANIDQTVPGRGTTDYPGHTIDSIPKATAMVLLAELDRADLRFDPQQKSLVRLAGRWLLEHADENHDGVIGWGVPVAWDAYGDGSVNPAHSEYTISTAIVVDALMTWRARDPAAPGKEILDKVGRAFDPYLNRAMRSPSGLVPYSLRDSDRPYDTFNPAAYMAGQLQRYSWMVRDASRQAALRAVADATMESLLRHRQVSARKSWYWNYSVQENVPNDLPHASYVIDGIRTYMAYGGRLSGLFDRYAVLGHMRDFPIDGGTVRGWPGFRGDVKTAARSYDLGFAMYLACSEEGLTDLRSSLYGTLHRYRMSDGRYAKYPQGADNASPLVVAEYEAYLYRGVLACMRAQREASGAGLESARQMAISWASEEVARVSARDAFAQTDSVPLLDPSLGSVVLDKNTKATVYRSGLKLKFEDAGIPLAILEGRAGRYVVFRRFPTDALWLKKLDTDSKVLCALPIVHGNVNPLFRAAALHGDSIYFAYFDNPSSANWLIRFKAESLCTEPGGVRTKIPSLEDPAGTTYEMIPALRFLVSPQDRLYLVGGTLEAQIHEAQIQVRRVPGCRHVVESVATPSGLAHLCVTPSPLDSGPRELRIVAPSGIAVPAVNSAQGAVWGLAWSQGRLQIEHARSADQLRSVFLRDFLSAQHSGWLETGLSNEEGRIPWSQVYYLNGLLDMLEVSRRSEAAFRIFGPLLAAARQRLDLEIGLIDQHYAQGRFQTRAFTVDRSRALFAVQTARLLLLFERYTKEVSRPRQLASLITLKRDVLELRNHIDVLARKGEKPEWISPGQAHLRWPKGSKFYFDGVAVPYNHQNEWAYAVAVVADPNKDAASYRAAREIAQLFIGHVAPDGNLPEDGVWNYWWGQAFDGWSRLDDVSKNKPEYPGDKGKAWISFRTIDAMSLIAVTRQGSPLLHKNVVKSTAALAARGLLYPLVNQSLVSETGALHLSPKVANGYSRLTSPWELANAVWSLSRLAPEVEP